MKKTLSLLLVFTMLLALVGCAKKDKASDEGNKKSKIFYRTIFYMPTVTPLIAVAFVWKIMYNPQIGLINRLTGLDINWLFNGKYALGAVLVMTIWKDFGYAVVLFLAGLYSLPKDCFEAAKIDGASGWQVFRHVSFPLLKQNTLFVVVTSIIAYM